MNRPLLPVLGASMWLILIAVPILVYMIDKAPRAHRPINLATPRIEEIRFE